MSTTKPKAAYWIIAIIAFVWNGMGVIAYLQQQYRTEAFRIQHTQEQLETISATPAWATTAFALAVFGGLFGSLALLFKKKLANLLFTISLLGILVQIIYEFFISNSMEVFGSKEMLMPIMIIIIGIFLFIYSKSVTTKGWLN